MRDPVSDDPSPSANRSSDRGVAVAIALSIVICLAAFVWIFVALDPILSDFSGTDVTVTSDPADPSVIPADENENTLP